MFTATIKKKTTKKTHYMLSLLFHINVIFPAARTTELCFYRKLTVINGSVIKTIIILLDTSKGTF